MKKTIWSLFIFLLFTQLSEAQSPTRYIVRFKDKANNPYSLANPSAYLSQRAISRRTNYSIAIDSTDLPVTPGYIDSIQQAGNVTILNVSKWLNSVSIVTTDDAALTKINSFPFVQTVAPIAARISNSGRAGKFTLEQKISPVPSQKETGVNDIYNYGASFAQIHIHNGEFLHNIGLRGETMIIGMLDAGFYHYQSLGAFDSARANGQILDTWDFVARESSVNEDDTHGMECFSTMASNIPGQFVGTAPKASFFLFRSEDSFSEYPIEEHNWVCAAERVDSAGGDVITSSLGYNLFDPPLEAYNHTYADMNGNTTMAAIGADLAAKKGILVIVSAGNEGDNSWQHIVTPADADSVLTVGAVNTAGIPAGFTSLGPSSDGRIKPDVASVGVNTTILAPNNMIGVGSGTSFACPNLAGLATCLWQGFKEFNNMKIIDALHKAGNRYTNPNDTIGYGIPDVKKAVMDLVKDFATTSASVANCSSSLQWTSKDMSAMRYEIERKLPNEASFTKIADQPGTGSVFTNHTYQFYDELSNVQAGAISYRILQVIDTSAAGYSAGYLDTLTVNTSTACKALDIVRIMPNPARSYFTIKINSTSPIDNLVIRIIDSKGSVVAVSEKGRTNATASFNISTGYLASGKYYVVVYNGSHLLSTQELIKL